MLLQLIDVPHWFLINMFLHFGFSRCLQVLVHRCDFHAARGESEWCIGLLLWCLAAQTVAARHLSRCWWLLLSSAPRVHKSTELLWHKTPDFTPDMQPPNRSDLNPVDYVMWTVIQECIYQKQQVSSYITDKLWLLTEWHIIFHKVGWEQPSGEMGNFVAVLLQITSISVCQRIIKIQCGLTKLLQK